jgi:hypothetical protein
MLGFKIVDIFPGGPYYMTILTLQSPERNSAFVFRLRERMRVGAYRNHPYLNPALR